MREPKTMVGILVLLVLIVCCLVYVFKIAALYPKVQEEIHMTPSPTPVYGNTMIVTPDPAAPTTVPILRNGSKGINVTQLQTRLAELGYLTGQIDGVFGNGTEAALIAFQSQNGLTADGIAGEATFSILYSDAAKAYTEVTHSPSPVPTLVPTQAPTQTPTPEPTPTPDVRTRGYVVDGMPILVNKSHLLPDTYQPYELVELNSYCPASVVKIKYTDMWAEKEAVDALLSLLEAGIAQGEGNWQISAAYRTVAQQQTLFDRQVNSYIKNNGLSRSKAISATRKTVADPGTSEHHLGLAFDITIPGKTFGSTSQAKWLAENCWDYGFILRYTEEKQQITGFLAEPWHFRYVGTEHSRIMHEENLCLEEYLEAYGNITFEDE